MDNKKIDNEIINTKAKINEIDDLIDNEKLKIKEIDDMQENVREINRGLNRCIDLLAKSIKGPNTSAMFQDMYDKNKSFYINMSSSLDEESLETRININKLYQQKDDIIKEEKKNRGADNASGSDKKGEFI